MRRIHRRARGLLIACLTSSALLQGAAVRAQESADSSIVDGVVKAVCRKQIVLLGELPSHGEARAFELKSKIADRLMAQCGFTAILFEAPIYDFIGLERALKGRTAAPEQLDKAIGRFWWTRELSSWRRTLFDAAARKGLMLGGIDDQVSVTSDYARATLPAMIAAASPTGAPTECQQTVSRHLGWTYDERTPFDGPEQRRLSQCARHAADAAARVESLDAADRAMLESFARYAARQQPGATTGRDESMYRNLLWYLDRLPKDGRVVIWTATVHAALRQGSLPEPPMAVRLAERWRDRVAAIGFTANAGFTSRAGRPASPIPDAPADSLEAAAKSPSPSVLLDTGKLRALGPLPSRLFGRFTTETWADYFDAVVVVRQEAAPTFDPWK
ncbi:MAG: erythromycin esterase family protein [Vicinamibacteria bacterium]|nr:erythromycin esterase family protein [Vicinamibacteria bacterium]